MSPHDVSVSFFVWYAVRRCKNLSTVKNLFLQRAQYLERDREIEGAHAVAASAGDTEVYLSFSPVSTTATFNDSPIGCINLDVIGTSATRSKHKCGPALCLLRLC